MDVPAAVAIWAEFSPVSLVTEDLLGSRKAAKFGLVTARPLISESPREFEFPDSRLNLKPLDLWSWGLEPRLNMSEACPWAPQAVACLTRTGQWCTSHYCLNLWCYDT